MGTLGVFGRQMRFDLARRISPADHQEGALQVGGRRAAVVPARRHQCGWLQERGCTIWDEWADAEGELGPVYGKQWRSWAAPDGRVIDQIAEVLRAIRETPASRRHVVSAWNPADVRPWRCRPATACSSSCRRGQALLPALPALGRRLPGRAVQHRQLRAADPHDRPGLRPGGRRVRSHARRRPPLPEPPRPGAAAADPRAAALSRSAPAPKGPTCSPSSRGTSRWRATSRIRPSRPPIAV